MDAFRLVLLSFSFLGTALVLVGVDTTKNVEFCSVMCALNTTTTVVLTASLVDLVLIHQV